MSGRFYCQSYCCLCQTDLAGNTFLFWEGSLFSLRWPRRRFDAWQIALSARLHLTTRLENINSCQKFSLAIFCNQLANDSSSVRQISEKRISLPIHPFSPFQSFFTKKLNSETLFFKSHLYSILPLWKRPRAYLKFTDNAMHDKYSEMITKSCLDWLLKTAWQ